MPICIDFSPGATCSSSGSMCPIPSVVVDHPPHCVWGGWRGHIITTARWKTPAALCVFNWSVYTFWGVEKRLNMWEHQKPAAWQGTSYILRNNDYFYIPRHSRLYGWLRITAAPYKAWFRLGGVKKCFWVRHGYRNWHSYTSSSPFV